jgi:hypothetical protein
MKESSAVAERSFLSLTGSLHHWLSGLRTREPKIKMHK